MRLTCVTIVATLLVLHHAASDKGGQLCKTPRGRMGTCRNVKSCKILLDIVDIYGQSAGDFLRGTMCDGDGSETLVCCPSLADDNRKDNGGRDDRKNGTDTGKKVNSTYGPLVAPVCGSNVSYQQTHSHEPYGEKVCPWCSWLGYFGYSPPFAIRWGCLSGLISSRHVLTAAYCAYERPDLRLARVGSHDPESDADGVSLIDVFIEKATVHPLFNIRTRANDIAVLRLQGDIEFTARIHPICLPVTSVTRHPVFVDLFLDVEALIAAKYTSGPAAGELRSFPVPVTAAEWCEYYLGNFENVTIDERIICISRKEFNYSNCQSLSPNILFKRLEGFAYLVGAMSVRSRCDHPEYPDVYTRVTSFLDFIEAQLN